MDTDPYRFSVLMALSHKPQGAVYEGTVSVREVVRRRIKARAARRARRANR